MKSRLLHKTGNEIIYKLYNLPIEQKIIYYRKDSPISNLRLVFKIPYLCFENISYQIDALNEILSGDLNSIFLKKLRTEHGLIYSLGMSCDCDEVDKELSNITISTLCNTINLVKVIKHIFEAIIDTKNILIENEYIKKYIEQEIIEYNKEKFSPSPEDVLDDYIQFLLWDKKIVSFDDNHKKSIDINQKKLNDTAKKIFDFNNMIICYDGKKNLDKSINELLNAL